MELIEVVTTSRRVAASSRRIEKVNLLSECLRCLRPEEVPTGTAYLTGEIPQGRIGLGPATLAGALPEVAAPSPNLTLREMDEALRHIASVSGAGSTAERTRLLGALFSRSTREEQDFLFRLLLGELRQGAQDGVMIEAIARAASLPDDREVRRAFMFSGSLSEVAVAALREGTAGLARFRIQLFHPVLPMLAQTAEDVREAFERLGEAALDYKLDGVRLQIHKAGSEVRLFTRRLNDITAAAPELVKLLQELPPRELILDGEALALDGGGRPLPFQTTMRRFGRKLDVERMQQELPLTAFAFDCLYLDGESLTDAPTGDRFAVLAGSLPPALRIPRLVTSDPARAEDFFRQALEAGHEGIMAKSLDGPYQAGARGTSWLKVKWARALDLVVLAAEWGHGRRRGYLSNLHLGARDPASGQFVMVGKTFKGLTDELLKWQTRRLLELEVARDAWSVQVRPEIVVETELEDVQESPQYPGGVALRFARVKRYRPDKNPSEADTLDAVRALQHRRSAR